MNISGDFFLGTTNLERLLSRSSNRADLAVEPKLFRSVFINFYLNSRETVPHFPVSKDFLIAI